MSHSVRNRRGVVFSDSHFLTGFWQMSPERFKISEVKKLLKGKDIAVLNGDIFDFSQSGIPIGEWLDRATDMLKSWLMNNPHCEFHYVIGNHDNYIPWIERLEQIAAGVPGRLHVHTEGHGWHIGNTLFTHGDFSRLKEGKRDLLTESEMQEQSQPGKKYTSKPFINKNDHEEKMIILLEKLEQAGKLKNIEHVFAGHFHDAAERFSPAGFHVHYHNTGSPTIDGAEFTPMLFDMDEKNQVSNVRLALPLTLRPNGPRIGV